jgi:hypothetical protein
MSSKKQSNIAEQQEMNRNVSEQAIEHLSQLFIEKYFSAY